ncbi:DUF4349 domain-containing protein [Mucilaginibacter sp. UR6-1]|uniref:DUF4349 domain-containing protein n=1 Tax=Mucilaginibacter sp. UR6-1 TaxID=1435643 RepID=UPI001E344A43|nr:DUF4349 domain-containing protein [Mucilaginibacter sp. UR6-1]MCC8410808.1 DUF4349 domain-containing protein [Mucilaginibacter sp. UR6-1]
MKTRALIALLCAAMALYSCRGNGNYSTLQNESSDTALVAADSVAFDQQKLIKTAGLTFKVTNVRKIGEEVTTLTDQYSGMVMNHHLRSDVSPIKEVKLDDDSVMRVSAFNTYADMTVKVPAERLTAFVSAVNKLGVYTTVSNMDIEDNTLQYLESQLRMDSRKELVKQQKQGRIKLKNPQDVLIFKDALVDEQINTKRIDAAVKYSTVSLNFFQNSTIIKERIPDTDPAIYNISFLLRLKQSLVNGVLLVADVFIALANLWVFVMIGVAMWLVYKYYRKKHPALFAAKGPVKSTV